jgi:cytochrome c553
MPFTGRVIRFTALFFAGVLLAASPVLRESLLLHARPLVAAVQTQMATHMKEHFSRVTDVLNAVMRGDLEDARASARWIADHQTEEGLPAKSGTQLNAMRASAKKLADTTDIRLAANAAATLASTCGTCHRSQGVTPALPEPPKASPGTGLEDHMRAHGEAVAYLYGGLVVPSDALWKKGADLLKAAPLESQALPKDPKVTDQIKAYEIRVHQFATLAQQADTKTRVTLYGELMASCAECHGLHGRVWGPGLPKTEP